MNVMKTIFAVVLLCSITPTLVSASNASNKSIKSVFENCIPENITAEHGLAIAPGQLKKTCATSQRQNVNPQVTLTKSATLPTGSCPNTTDDLDVIVSTITQLREAVDNSPEGTVVGVDGELDINSDGFDDLIIAASDIVLTCASDNAMILGYPNQAVISVVADNVTVDNLKIVSLTERALQFSSVSHATVTNNIFECDRTCINIVNVDSGVISNNDLGGVPKLFGIALVASSEFTIDGNTINECYVMCILTLDLNGSKIINNSISIVDIAGVYLQGANNVTVDSNYFTNCTLGFSLGSCILVAPFYVGPEVSNDITITNNNLDNCSPIELIVFPEQPAGGADCMRFFNVNNLTVVDNTIKQNIVDLFILEPDSEPTARGLVENAIFAVNVFDATIKNNTITEGSAAFFDVFGIKFHHNTAKCTLAWDAPYACVDIQGDAASVVDNIILSGNPEDQYFATGGIGLSVSSSDQSVIISDNTVTQYFSRGISVANGSFENLNGAEITGNRVGVDTNHGGVSSGIYIYGIDNAIVRYNTIDISGVAETNDAQAITIAGNKTSSTYSLLETGELLFEFSDDQPIRNALVANNRASGVNYIGAVLNQLCSSTFMANNFRNAKGDYFLYMQTVDEFETQLFDFSTFTLIDVLVSFVEGGVGDSVFVGNNTVEESSMNSNATLVGDGTLDCDGDGMSESNKYLDGAQSIQGGFGARISSALTHSDE